MSRKTVLPYRKNVKKIMKAICFRPSAWRVSARCSNPERVLRAGFLQAFSLLSQRSLF